MAVGYFKIGDVLVEQGDKASALQEFRRGLPGVRAVAVGDPTNVEWPRDLSLGLMKISDMLVAKGDTAEALQSLNEPSRNRHPVVVAAPRTARLR